MTPLIPPFLVFTIGLTTHRIVLGFFCGIGSAALLATAGDVYGAAALLVEQFYENLEIDEWRTGKGFIESNHLFILGFVIFTGIVFDLLKRSKGIEAMIRVVGKRIRSKKSAETTSLVLSHLFFIDGCLSSITVSSIMRPISDRLKMARVKTAFLADSMAGPLVVLCPFSCFTALLIGLLSANGVGIAKTLIDSSPSEVYLHSIPYVFYSFSTVAVLWFTVCTGISIGPMKKFEEEALHLPDEPRMDEGKGSLADFLLPALLFLLFFFLFNLLFTPSSLPWWIRLTDAPISFVLFFSSFLTVFFTALSYCFQKILSWGELGNISLASLKSNQSNLLVIFLAWNLASLLKNNLGLSEELTALLKHFTVPELLPLLLFWITSIVTIALGTSWGTIAIFVPLVSPLVLSSLGLSGPVPLADAPLLLPSLGAVISGAALGDHVSLVSDSTLLAAAGARCHPADHVKTQAPYALPVLVATSCGFLAAGFLSSSGYLVPLAISLSMSIFLILAIHLRSTLKLRRVV